MGWSIFCLYSYPATNGMWYCSLRWHHKLTFNRVLVPKRILRKFYFLTERRLPDPRKNNGVHTLNFSLRQFSTLVHRSDIVAARRHKPVHMQTFLAWVLSRSCKKAIEAAVGKLRGRRNILIDGVGRELHKEIVSFLGCFVVGNGCRRKIKYVRRPKLLLYTVSICQLELRVQSR